MIVHGLASTAAKDGHGDIVLQASLYDAAMRKGAANVRLLIAHDEAKPAGRILAFVPVKLGLFIWAELDHTLPGVAGHIAAIATGQSRGFSVGAKMLRVGGYAATVELCEISLTPHPSNLDCIIRPSPWPRDFAEMLAAQDAAAMAAPKFELPEIRYHEDANP